mgnify:CR=1 FL=1
MASPLPYMQFYPTDYLSDTQHLTTEEHGAYLLILMNYWQRGEPPLNDDQRLAGIARMPIERWLNARSTLVEFFCIKNNRWFHKRIENDINKVKSARKQQSEAGKRSAAKRLKKRINLTVVEAPFNSPSTVHERDSIYTESESDTEYLSPTN